MHGQERNSSEGCNPVQLPAIWDYRCPRNFALGCSEGRTKRPGMFQSTAAVVLGVRHPVRQLSVWAGIPQNGSTGGVPGTSRSCPEAFWNRQPWFPEPGYQQCPSCSELLQQPTKWKEMEATETKGRPSV